MGVFVDDEAVVPGTVPHGISEVKQQHGKFRRPSVHFLPHVTVVSLTPVLDRDSNWVVALTAFSEVVALEVAGGGCEAKQVVEIVKHVRDVEGLHDSSIAILVWVLGIGLEWELEVAALAIGPLNTAILEDRSCLDVVTVGQVASVEDLINPSVLGCFRVLGILDNYSLAVFWVLGSERTDIC